ncbi:MAG: hypothetical protein H7839_15975 [Magnetococcus sp. YQC-5]
MHVIEFPPDMETQLKTITAKTGSTIAALVIDAVWRYLEDMQDVEAARQALEEYEREGGGISLNDFVCELGLRV